MEDQEPCGHGDGEELSREEFERRLREELFDVPDFLTERGLKEAVEVMPYLIDALEELVQGGGRPDPFVEEKLANIGSDMVGAKNDVDRGANMWDENMVLLLRVIESEGGKELSDRLMARLMELHSQLPEGPAKDAAGKRLELFYSSEKLPPSDEGG